MGNRLADETSPYLLQHAENPVDWYPWGEEAFAKAREEDKPIFLSVGYSACHWCHVMERESFESDRIASLLNKGFVPVKVDREERPDVDSIYMSAVQMMTGHGGWPMSVFLTPDGRPFFGGTYYPPEDRQGMPGFDRILRHVSTLWEEKRETVEEAAGEVGGAVARSLSVTLPETPVTVELLNHAAAKVGRSYDPRNGGFGTAPKFPPAMTLDWLLQVHRRTGDEKVLAIATHTLEAMANGGIYDHLGGGFARYSVDERWLVPHFEKMLYDNALLTSAYVHGWQVTKDPLFERVVSQTLGFVTREMLSPEGGFYATLDADSEGEEGKFYVWSRDEIDEHLGDEAEVFSAIYDVTAGGNFEGNNILNRPKPLDELAEAYGLTREEIERVAERGRARLLEVRSTRVRPARDEKIIASWNGWMLAAVSEAALAFESSEWRALAEKNANYLLETLIEDGRVFRLRDSKGRVIPGMLEDHGGVCWGLIAAFEATQRKEFLESARKVAETILRHFAHDEGGFYDVPDDHEGLITRPRELFDNATPSGNSLAIRSLQKLALYYGDADLERAATRAIRSITAIASEYPSGFGFFLAAAEWSVAKPLELVITGRPGENALWRAVGENFLPHRILASSDIDGLPVTEGKRSSQPTAWVCRGYVCSEPVNEVEDLERGLATAG